MKLLVLCDDLWHPAEVIELGFSKLKERGFEITFVRTAKDILTPKLIAEYPVVVNCKGDCVNAANTAPWFEEGVTEVGPREFGAYVENGGGFLSFHAGNTCGEGTAMAGLVGCGFIGHPPRCGVDVTVTGEHPITRGIPDFHIRDEHYQVTLSAGDATELFRTRSETGGEQVGGYVRTIGRGRLCVLTPGHTLEALSNAAYQALLENAIRWCAGGLS